MKYLQILSALTFCILSGTATAQKSSSWMTGFDSLWGLIADSTRRSIEGVTKATGIDLFGKNGLLSKSIVPTPPALYENPPLGHLPTEPNYAIIGQEQRPDFVPDMSILQEPLSMRHASKRDISPRGHQQVTCTSEYAALPGHTMCMHDKPDLTESGITELDKVLILRHHNRLRGQVEPPATDLVKLKWDDRLAAVAQKWANQCKAGHDKDRSVPSIGMSVGQNVAGGYRSWQKAVQMWYDEIEMWTYGVGADANLGKNGWTKIGHFTQMVQNVTYLLGCGYAMCEHSVYKRYYVCDYAAGQSNIETPYTKGPRCSKCPNSCQNGQCNCKGVVCFNGGTLDPNSCTCQCNKLYAGRMCDKLNCPENDDFKCGRDFPKSFCRYSNVPEVCPYMCGICKGKPIPKPTTYTSAFGCTYTGIRSSPAECSNFGAKGQDTYSCGSNGGRLNCMHCKKFFNVKTDMCPVMCGLCDPPCGGKRCLNGGKLNTSSCKCKCKRPYVGEVCGQADCPPTDHGYCKNWPSNYCKVYSNVPRECPYMCGICH